MKLKEIVVRVPTASGVAILLATLLIAFVTAFVTGGCSVLGNTSPPSATQQSAEVAALQTHVFLVVKDLRVTWYLNESSKDASIYWKRGKFSRSSENGAALFDQETEAAFKQFTQAIQTSGVPTNRLVEAKFADDGTLSFASFMRRGGGITYVFTYIYSPGTKPPEWKSKLGPVVLTRIGDSDWWFEQSPDD